MRDSCASKGAHRVGSRVGMCLVLGLGCGDQAHSILVNHKQLYIYIYMNAWGSTWHVEKNIH